MVNFNKYSSEAHANFVMDYGYWHKADPKRVAFVYLLGILKVTREHIRYIFNFETEEINPECLSYAWITPLARRTIMLAYNLYTNWIPEEYPEDCSPSAIFDNDKIREFLIEGVRLRYKEKLGG